ncbi:MULTISPECIES: hypothetical protein [Chromobacterium]|uniref:hypothetical protein n=1 Tax=Chromobacterium TaxID=535 RepID=UPI0018871E12|nr:MULTISPECIES: hypothetical protein [Chromobacterium]QOZ81974.1 hypothetical protein DXT74_02205 [Chromobacterium sp. Rain0013]WON81978.1 hypothetical protein OK026_12495 [Chromobacterium haemolyticum]
MSYLQFPRLAFSGQFQSDVSTVNNDPRHYDNATFEPRFQEYQQAGADGRTKTYNGWWHPTGTAIMRFANCQVTSLRGPSGILVTNPAQDPLLSCSVGNAIGKPSGKMVDLDPDWQLASSIYGLAVSLLKPDGTPLMTADYQSNPFRDLWFSRAQSQGDSAASAVFQSVLINIQWHLDGFDSPLLARLIELSEQDRLSIRLSTYGYSTDYSDPGFGYGTVLGAIGPAYLGQPRSFILGRRFMPTTQQGNDLASQNGIGCFSSWLDQDTASLQVDLSNALPLDSRFQVAALPSLQYAVLHNEWTAQDADIGPDDYTVIAGVDTSQALQDQQAGIQSVPLTEEQLRLANQPLPLAIVQPVGVEGRAVVCVREALLGNEVRAEDFAIRLDPNHPDRNHQHTHVYAARYGQPLAGAALAFWAGAPMLDYDDTPTDKTQGTTPRALLPVNNVPNAAIRISPAEPITDQAGRAAVTLHGPESFGTPREYMDGQLFTIAYNLAGSDPALQQPFDNFAVVVFSSFPQPGQDIDLDNPRWEDVQPILQQYANLYPVMSQGLFDFSKQAVADASAFIMRFVFDKPIDDPDQMPVTRDLSASKRRMLINYFQNVIDLTGKTFDRQRMYGKRCPLRQSAPPSEADIAATRGSLSTSKSRKGNDA